MKEYEPEKRPRLEEVPELVPERDTTLPIEVIEGILKEIYQEENGDDKAPRPPTIH